MRTKRLLAMLLVLVMALAVFAGCQPAEPVVSDEPNPGDAPASAEPVPTEDPNAYKYGGTFIHPTGGDPGTMLYFIQGGNGSTFNVIMGDVLFYLDVDTREINYRVCDSMEINDEQTVYKFHIRDGVKWHDGTPVTAEDVVWSHDVWQDEGWFYPVSWTIPGKWEALDEQTVQVTLEHPDSSLLETIHLYLTLQPKHYFEGLTYDEYMTSEQALHPIGCGPFKFEEYAVGDYVKFVANEDFWNGRPYLDEYILKIGASAGSEGEINFETGQIDMYKLDKSYYREMEDRTDEFQFVVNEQPTTNYGIDLLPFINDASFFSNYDMRLAMTYMFDYDSIIDQLYYGYASRQQSMFAPALSCYRPVTDWKYDPAEANRILDEAGLVDTDGNGIRNWPVEVGGNGLDMLVQLWYGGAGGEAEYLSIVLADAMAQCQIAAIPYLINSGTFMEKFLTMWDDQMDEDEEAVLGAFYSGAQIVFPSSGGYAIWPSEWKYMTDILINFSASWQNWYDSEEQYNELCGPYGYSYNDEDAVYGVVYDKYGQELGDKVIELSNLTNAAIAETDPEKQQEMYTRMQELYCNEMIAYIPFAGSWDILGFSKRVHLEECDFDLRAVSMPWDMEHLWVE